MQERQTVVVYIDGFNLYRRSLEKRQGVKWLDLEKLSRNLLPDYEVVGVEYFTANIKPTVNQDPRASTRQQIYLRALATLSPFLKIHFGQFRADKRYMPLIPQQIDPITGELKKVAVLKIEEKGSDVHLAARMVADSITGRCDVVVLLSNDSDHFHQLEMLTKEYGKKVGLILPFLETKRSSKQLRSLNLEFSREITVEALKTSQFPSSVDDAVGRFTMPETWA
jgi:uncharacterized LabA/DUF88 family protein